MRNKKLDKKMERNNRERIITMKFLRFISVVNFLIFLIIIFLYSITLTIIVKTETHGPLKSRPGIKMLFTQLHRLIARTLFIF